MILYEQRLGQKEFQSVIKQAPRGNQKFRELPEPTGVFPYHLSLEKILSVDQMSLIENSGYLAFHVVGDTGGIVYPVPQGNVAYAMISDLNITDKSKVPAFFYHLGDVVYYYGESAQYYPQFYEQYKAYASPIFAIPGNHDGDVSHQSNEPSLAAFARNFCAKTQEVTNDAGEVTRSAMIQPNVYWTLDAPFLTIIGLYSNVPEGGEFDQKQIDWLKEELANAPKDKAVIICVHHPAFSLDIHHSGSSTILNTLDTSFQESGRIADIVLTAHVHNYQRFTRRLGDQQVPYIVAGAGGYWNLHHMQTDLDGNQIEVPFMIPGRKDVDLENYCDNHYGYLLMQAGPNKLSGEYHIVSHPWESWCKKSQKIDRFDLDLQTHQLVRNTIKPHV